MANTSQNGWSLMSGYSDPKLDSFSAITGKVRDGHTLEVFQWLEKQYEKRVETINKAASWGFAPRPIRGGTTPSNHASGTAVDFNANKHPLGVRPTRTMSKAQIAACKAIAKESGGVLRWGGSYILRADTMHWEINASATKVAAFVSKIRGGSVKVAPSKVEKKVIKTNLTPAVKAKLKAMGYSKQTSTEVRAYQKAHELFVDGNWGGKTEARYDHNVKLQKAVNLMKSTTAKVKVDGFIGASSTRRINDVVKRNGWTRAILTVKLKAVGAYK